ncbi:hypothetical protein HDV01_000917 [Terramyces sp. JEL0728]|nr:hypothetical protein HDV01_000917 [Terramyces sp. JEL0728]
MPTTDYQLTDLTVDILEFRMFYYLKGMDLSNLSLVNRAMRNRMFPIQIFNKLAIPPDEMWPVLHLNFKGEHKMKNINEPWSAISIEDAMDIIPHLSTVNWRFQQITVNSTSFSSLYKHIPFAQHVKLHVLDDVCFEELSFALGFNFITEMHFEPVPGITEIDVHYLMCNIESMSKLDKLAIRTPIDLEIAWIISEYLPKSQITVLDLEGCKLDYEHLAIICPSLEKTNVAKLVLSRNPLYAEGIECLATVLRKTRIQELVLDSIEIGGEALLPLSSGLMNSNVRMLSLNDNNLEDDVYHIFTMLAQTRLEQFRYNSNLGPRSIETLIRNLPRSQLKRAAFGISHEYLQEFLHSTSLSSLEELELTTNGDYACSTIALNPQHFQFKKFTLTAISISPQPFSAFVSILPNTKLESLVLEGDIGDAGLAIIAQYLPKTRIRRLVANQCNFGDAGAKALASVLYSTRLLHLEMQSLNTTQEGVAAVLNSLGRSLRFLDISTARIADRDHVRQLTMRYPHMTIKY